MPEYFFYHYICQWCGKHKNNVQIKKCSSCKLVSYCCIEHQKNDWIIHKKLCRIVAHISKNNFSLLNFNGKTQKEWNQFRTQFIVSVELLLNRKLEIYETQMILFPNVCNICFKYNLSYYPCNRCYCTYYCCEDHLITDNSNHSKVCQQLKLGFEVDILLNNNHIKLVNNSIKSKIATKIFPSNIEEYLNTYMLFNNLYEKIFTSETLSFVLSLVYVMLKIEDRKLFYEEITIHLIGCRQHESKMLQYMEIFFQWFEQLITINIVMIGPECDMNSTNISLSKIYKGKKFINIKTNNLYYHKYANRCNYLNPHIIIAFNCGFSEFTGGIQDTWSETIQHIMNMRNTLFITTSYTKQEADFDFNKVVDNNINNSKFDIILKSSRNPYHSLRPLRDWETDSQVFYINNFITVLLL